MKASFALTLLGAMLALAAPTPTTDKGSPSPPESYGAEKSVSWQPYKRHIPTEPEPYGPTKSVSHQPWKRAVVDEAELEERNDDSKPAKGGEPSKPYPSGAWQPYKRNVEEAMPEPEHFEVLTA